MYSGELVFERFMNRLTNVFIRLPGCACWSTREACVGVSNHVYLNQHAQLQSLPRTFEYRLQQVYKISFPFSEKQRL